MIMKNLIISACFAVVATTAIAECPPAPDHSARLQSLIEAAQHAPDETSAQLISNDMWGFWADAPDDTAQQILDDGLVRRSGHDLEGAVKAFEQLIAYCPNYAEGYNQRAFALFIRKEYEPALVDLDRAIALSPKHIAAIAGKALTLIALKRDAEAQVVLREALALNPWLKERRFLTGDAPTPETDL